MKLITKDTDYAVRTLCFMAIQKDKIFSVSELSRSLKISKPFLRKICQILNKEKILRSYKGKGGGFRLARPLEKIFLIELIEIFQGPIKLKDCIFRKRLCPRLRNCLLKKEIESIEKFVISKIKSITLGSLSLRKIV